MKNYKFIIASFLLLLFTAAQISIVHEFAHDDSDSLECSVCVVAQDFQTQSFDIPSPVSFNVASHDIIKEKVLVDLAFVEAETQPTIHTTRPPPSS